MVAIRPLALAILMLALLPASALADATTQIIVKREPGLNAAERADIRADADVRFVESLSLPRTEVVQAQTGDVVDALRDLNADADVVYAERDRVRTAAADPYFGFLWGVPMIGADDAWLEQDAAMETITGDGQIVAVVDSGIDPTHPDLADRIDTAKDFVEPDGDALDGDGHGTHVSGTIAAEKDNDEGVAGIAPDARIMALRVLDDRGEGFDSDIAEAFRWAADHGVRVVNASLAGEGASQTLREAIAYADETLFVVAAGNGGPDLHGDDNDEVPIYPCNTPEPNVLCAGATTHEDVVASFSNEGARSVDVFAPGESILSTVPVSLTGEHWELPPENSGMFVPYQWYQGTSMAAPHVSAVAALVTQAAPALETEDIKEVLLASADPGSAFEGRSVSDGRLNAVAAVQLALAGTPPGDDTDQDGWIDAADACPDQAASPSPDGCPLDDDWDGVLNDEDNCDLDPNADQEDLDGDFVGDACDTDIDGDGVLNGPDNCDLAPNSGQENLDGDFLGDACDPDIDGDGVPNGADICDTKKGPVSNAGCPVPVNPPKVPTKPTTPTRPTTPVDSDRDGRPNVSDACPTEPALTATGCPLAQVAALSAKAKKRGKKRSARIAVVATRVATMRVTVERRKGRRWVRVARRKISGTTGTVKLSRLKRGRHRVRVSITSSGGTGTSVSKTFRVR